MLSYEIAERRCPIKRLLFFFLVVFTIVYASEQRPFIWVDDEDYCPAIYKDANGRPAGIFNDILTEAFKRLGIELKKEVYPWKRAQKLVLEKKADGMVTLYTKQRKKYMVATKPIWYIKETIFFRRDNPKACKILKINSFEDMKDLVLVETMGSGWAREQFEKHGIKHVFWVPTVDSAFNVLAKGRADIYMMYDINAYNILMKKQESEDPLAEEFQQIVAIAPTFASLPFRLLIRKDSPYANIIERFNEVIEEMKRDGTYKRIKMKYLEAAPAICAHISK